MKKIYVSFFIFIFVSCQNEVEQSTPKPLNEVNMFNSMMKDHYSKIFPYGNRNSGGPMFFKYIYENLANNHEEFIAYNKFYCGVSGSIIMPDRPKRYTTVKIRNSKNECVKGNYYRCCWPCSGDIMKYARVDKIILTLPKDPKRIKRMYNVLTMNDPCAACVKKGCPNFPPEVAAFKCKDGITQNGLRILNGTVTKSKGNARLIFAVFHESSQDDEFSPNFPKQCSKRHSANIDELNQLGGMGNIFVKLSQLVKQETYPICEI